MKKNDKIFICYVKEDAKVANKIYSDLKLVGLNPWLDSEDILPGQKWKETIERSIRESSYFLILLSSNSISKNGYSRKELKIALDIFDTLKTDAIFIIPVRLDNCKPDEKILSELHWVDIFPSYNSGLKRIISVLKNQKIGKLFWGRKRQLSKIISLLTSKNPQSVSIVGEHKIGKTSISLEIFNNLMNIKTIFPIFLDCSKLPKDCISEDSFFQILNSELKNAVEAKKDSYLNSKYNDIFFNNFISFENFIKEESMNELSFTIFLDEFEHLIKKDFATTIFFNKLNSIHNKLDKNIAFITISMVKLDIINIDSLRWYFGNFIDFENEDAKTIEYYAGDFPFLNEIVCEYIIENKNKSHDNTELEKKVFPYYKRLWDDRTKEEQYLLKNLENIVFKSLKQIDFEEKNLLNNMVFRGILVKKSGAYLPFSEFFVKLINEHFAVDLSNIVKKYDKISHEYIHSLLEKNSLTPIKILSSSNYLAHLYLILFDEKNNQDINLESLKDKINYVSHKMTEDKTDILGTDIALTLHVAYKIITSSNIEDVCEEYKNFERITILNSKIEYLRNIQPLIQYITEIVISLNKIILIEKIETKRMMMSLEKQKFDELTIAVEEAFYEPFASIWQKALAHCSTLIDQKINLAQGSAFLNIELKNKELMASQEDRLLYFEISNTGQEFASNISIEIQCDSTAVDCKQSKAEIAVIESGMSKEISFSIKAHQAVRTHIRGKLKFSDRAKKDREVAFSFQISILQKNAEFREIRSSYMAGGALPKQSDLFYGREDVYEFIDKNILVSEAQHRTMVCYGLRRTGKSSLLYQIEKRGFSDKRLIPVYLDMQGIDDEGHFYSELSEKIGTGLSLGTVADIEKFGQFKQFLKHSEADFGEKIIVFLIDEFEELQQRVADGRMSKSVFSNIRHLMQHEQKMIFLFCGTHKLEEMAADYWSIFFDTATYLKISFLKQDETEKLIREPVKDQLEYDDLAVEQIWKMTHGHPYLTQLVCETIVNNLNWHKKRNYAVIDDADDAVDSIITGGNDKFSESVWSNADTRDHLILSAAAEEMTNRQLDIIGFDTIYDKISLVAKDIPKRQCLEALDKLVSKDILWERDMRYYFPVNLLRKWVAKRYPLRKVREELG